MAVDTNPFGKPRRKGPNIHMVPASATQAKHLNVEGEPITRTHSSAGGAAEPSFFDGLDVVEIAEAALEGGVEMAGTIVSKAIDSAGDMIS